MAADWFVGPVMENLINRCFAYLEDQFKWQTGMKKELERLREKHPKIQAVVFAATKAQIGEQNPALNKWLWQLRDAIDEADDLLDEFEYTKHKEQVAKNSEETKVLSATTNFLFETALKLGKIGERALKIDPSLNRLEEVVQKLDKISSEIGTFLDILGIIKQEQQDDLHKTRETGPSPSDDLIGRSKDKKFVLQWLRQPSNEDHETQITATDLYRNISLLSIVGHGGMGKTTLLQHVYEDVANEFDVKMWVCVSNNFDTKKVIADMLECLKKERPSLGSISTLQGILKSEVHSKKFLLILDDIWDEEEQDKGKWEKVFASLAYGSLGSKILVTTRKDSVAAMIAKVIKKKKETLILKGLEEDECLQLLNIHAFVGEENPDDHKKLRYITVEIAKKLSGSPLAAKVIGGALNSNLDKRHWITILNSDFRSAEFVQNGILPILKLSYTYLPRSLQNCFAFCSIFPQDHKFDKDDLVRMWIALGFIQSCANQEETVEDIGGRYFDVLVKKSFFDEFQNNYGTHYKMHDLLHELAQSISAHECFRVVWDKELHSRIPETIRHFSIETENLEILKQIGKYKRLRSLFLCIYVNNEEIVDALTKIFQSLRNIRLLYISCHGLRLIPEVIGNLVHLRYLKINHGIQLPGSLSNLYHLRFIICDSMNDFLPRDMNNLFNLRYLGLPRSYFDKINGIGKLRSLQKLNGFSIKNEVGHSVQELEHMNELRQLRIKLLENVKDAEQAGKAKLSDKRNLTDLSLEWGEVSILDEEKEPAYYIEGENFRNIVNLDLDTKVLDNLQPHSSLKKLRIHSFMGARSPIWLNNADLMSNLEYIQLDNCLEWQTLPPFGKLPSLKSLYLRNIPKAKSFDFNKKYYFFPSLELLHIEELDALEDWFDATITDDCFFPCLTELYLGGCLNLNELPCLPPKLKSLKILNIGWKTLSCRSISKSNLLEKLTIWECPNITCISFADNITRLTAFRYLEIEDCPNLISLESLSSLSSLTNLKIDDVPQLQLLPNFPSSLEYLELRKLKSLQCLPSSVSTISSLKTLRIEDVPLVQQLPDLPSSLESLYMQGCHEELRKRYDVISGFDRDKLAHIPHVRIS